MSRVDTLLDNIDENGETVALTDSEPHIVVGSNRFILVPQELKRIGVQHDHNVETVTFDCIRYWDEHDLSTMVIHINFRAANGYVDEYQVTDVVVDDNDPNTMHFTWTIGEDVTQAAGSIAFLVCIRDTEDVASATVHWNSETNKDMYVSPGIRVG